VTLSIAVRCRRPAHQACPDCDTQVLISLSVNIPERLAADSIMMLDGVGVAMSGDRSRERRRLAAECLEVAKRTSDAGVRASLLEMAQRWLDLAELCEHDAWNQKLRLRALQAAIGKELRVHYELPQQLPHRILALLMQLTGQTDAD
jgi:hypothetical protein